MEKYTIYNEEEKILLKKEEHIFENYVLNMNKKLHKENDSLINHLKILENEKENLEEDIEKEEKSKIYMKGLMHNLYDMKQKSFKIVDKRKQIHNHWEKFFNRWWWWQQQ